MHFPLHFPTMAVFCALTCAAVEPTTTAAAPTAPTPPSQAPTEACRVLDIAPVWSGHSVGFSLMTVGDDQFAAFYDAERHMTIAHRKISANGPWRFTRLPSRIGWDSHNYVTMTVDRAGYLHVCGNMHASPLVYFRSTRPLAPETLVRVPAMVGREEDRVTYPVFMRDAEGRLVFAFRHGRSGKGDTYYNRYDEAAASWRRLGDGPILSGEGKMNAYPHAPLLGPDGWFHLSWVWRDTPAAETNHDLSYARSRDLEHWETVDGRPLKLPITLRDKDTIVEPVPVRGGIINGSGAVGFDLQKRVVLAFHKYDEAGKTQLYFARRENGAWKVYQATAWDYRWEFSGGGSLVSELHHGGLAVRGKGLAIQVSHKKYGSGLWEVDPVTLKLGKKLPAAKEKQMPRDMAKVRSKFPGMQIRTAGDHRPELTPEVMRLSPISAQEGGRRYQLRWETLPANRDKPRPEPWPEPSLLQLVEWP